MKKVITIDGPAGSGKSTLARNLASKLKDFVLLDSGSYYRWATYLCLCDQIDLCERSKVYQHVKDKMKLEFSNDVKNDEIIVKHEGKKINDLIFAPLIGQQVSEPAQNYRLRNLIKKEMRLLAEEHNVVLAGRDTGSYTFPEADLKIFLIADVEKRARRRYLDLKKTGREIAYEEVLFQMKARDRRDSEETDSPLKKPRGAVVIDSSDLTARQTLNTVWKFVLQKVV